jgi:hypothetical protein
MIGFRDFGLPNLGSYESDARITLRRRRRVVRVAATAAFRHREPRVGAVATVTNLGIGIWRIRMSAGIEHEADLLADLRAYAAPARGCLVSVRPVSAMQ